MVGSYQETVNRIANLRGGEIDLKLHRVKQALALFDDPQACYPAFHIAGTNGKGSTAAILQRVLSGAGYRAGLYTSPHLTSFTERIRVAQAEITPDEVVELAALVQERAVKQALDLTFFEFVTVMALVYFAQKKVDVAVVEVGLGGRLDATNVVLPVSSVITTISRDHQAYLGSDLLSIAREKAGIMKRGIPAVCGLLPEEVRGLYRELAAGMGVAPYFCGEQFSAIVTGADSFDYRGLRWDLEGLSLALPGGFQRTNAAVALAALETAAHSFPVSETTVRKGLQEVCWPGRMEIVLQRPQVILDGAHNPEGIATLVGEMQARIGKGKVKLLFAAMEDKEWRLMLGSLCAIAHEIVLTKVPTQRSADPEKVAKAVPEGTRWSIVADPLQALRHIIRQADPGDVILVTGSLYLVGEVRPYFFTGEDAFE